MVARDKPRLTVLRAILADITNSSKTSTPITDDVRLLALLKKRVAATRQSLEQFYEADRKDLVAGEEEQLRILEEYTGTIKTMGDEEIHSELVTLVARLCKEKGGEDLTTAEVMKKSSAPGGPFEGKTVSKGDIARVAKQILQPKK
jgi:uncharacterized protein YqeY